MTASDPTIDTSPGAAAVASGSGRFGPPQSTAPQLPEMSAAVQAAYGDDPMKQDRRNVFVGAQVSSVLMEMLRRCERRDIARSLWPDVGEHVPLNMRYGSAYTGFLAIRYGTELHPRHWHTVCAYGPSPARLAPQRRARDTAADAPNQRAAR
jgi:hypothetical protein